MKSERARIPRPRSTSTTGIGSRSDRTAARRSTGQDGRCCGVRDGSSRGKELRGRSELPQAQELEGTSSVARLRSGEKHGDLRAVVPHAVEDPRCGSVFPVVRLRSVVELRLTVYSDKGVHWQSAVPRGRPACRTRRRSGARGGGDLFLGARDHGPSRVSAAPERGAFFEILSANEAKELESSLAKIDQGGEAQRIDAPSFFTRVFTSIAV